MRQAVQLVAAAESLRTMIGVPIPSSEQVELGNDIKAARTALGEQAFATARTAGQELPLDQIVAHALDSTISAL